MQLESAEGWNDLSPAEKAKSLKEAADNARRVENYQLAYGYYIQALHLYRGLEDRANILRLLINLGNVAGWADFHDGLGMFERCRLLAGEAIPLAREIGDAKLLAAALCAFSSGIDDVKPLDALEEGLKFARLSGDKSNISMVLTHLASHLHIYERERSNELRLEALNLYQELDDKAAIASVLVRLAVRAKGTEKRCYLESAHQI